MKYYRLKNSHEEDRTSEDDSEDEKYFNLWEVVSSTKSLDQNYSLLIPDFFMSKISRYSLYFGRVWFKSRVNTTHRLL